MSEKVWDILMKATVPIAIILSGSLISHEVKLAQHDLRIESIEHSRFTSREGMKLEREIKSWMDGRFPPAWLREDLAEIKARIGKIEEKIK